MKESQIVVEHQSRFAFEKTTEMVSGLPVNIASVMKEASTETFEIAKIVS